MHVTQQGLVDGSQVLVVEISPKDYATLDPSDVIDFCVECGAINDQAGCRTYRVHDPFFSNQNSPDLTADEIHGLFEA